MPKYVLQSVQEKWQELGPFQLKNYILENKIEFDDSLLVKEETEKVFTGSNHYREITYGQYD